MQNKTVPIVVLLLLLSACSWQGNQDKTPATVVSEQKGQEDKIRAEEIAAAEAAVAREVEAGAQRRFQEEDILAAENSVQNATDEKAAEAEREIFAAAVQAGDPKQCEKIVGEERRVLCGDNALLQKAIKEKNSAFCREISSERAKEECSNLSF